MVSQMRILCAGDRITNRNSGGSYVRLLQNAHPDWYIVNAGGSGWTLQMLGKRLLEMVQADATFDAIVLQTGYNDLLLPSFAYRNRLFRAALRHCIRKAHAPIDSAPLFGEALKEIIQHIQSICKAKIIVTTIACLGENLSSELNVRRRQYNDVIRKTAQYCNCSVADTSMAFYECLSQHQSVNDLFLSFWNTILIDPFARRLHLGAEALSRYRGLQLTIDGCHLNAYGTDLFKAEVEQVLLQVVCPERMPIHQAVTTFRTML
jgi:lysophospholipase L1-like esterase